MLIFQQIYEEKKIIFLKKYIGKKRKNIKTPELA